MPDLQTTVASALASVNSAASSAFDLNNFVKLPDVKIDLSESAKRFILAVGLAVFALIVFKPFKKFRL